jgi:hypothetical protein
LSGTEIWPIPNYRTDWFGNTECPEWVKGMSF